MTNREQAREMLRQFFVARREAPWVAAWFEDYTERDVDPQTGRYRTTMGPRGCLERVGGMGEAW